MHTFCGTLQGAPSRVPLTGSMKVNDAPQRRPKTINQGAIRPLSEPIDLAMDASCDPCHYRRLSPEEPHQALLLQVAARIAEGADDKELCTCQRYKGTARAVQHLASQIACDI